MITTSVLLLTSLAGALLPLSPVDRADDTGLLRLARAESIELTGIEIALDLDQAKVTYRLRKTDASAMASALVEFPLPDYGTSASRTVLELAKPEMMLDGVPVPLKCLERAFVAGRDVTEDLLRHGLESDDVLGMSEKSRTVPRGWWQSRSGKVLDAEKVSALRRAGLFSEIDWLKLSWPLWRVRSKCKGEIVLGGPRDAVLDVSHRTEHDAGPLDWGDDRFFERSCLSGAARRAVRGWNPFAAPIVGAVGSGFNFRGAATWGRPNATVMLLVADPRVNAVSACLGDDAVRTAPNALSRRWTVSDLPSAVEVYFYVRPP